MSLEGRTCIVTGGSRGLGRSTALGLARLGADVVLVSRDEEHAEQARDEIVRTTGNERVEWYPGPAAPVSSSVLMPVWRRAVVG